MGGAFWYVAIPKAFGMLQYQVYALSFLKQQLKGEPGAEATSGRVNFAPKVLIIMRFNT
jgi:hypothetical protein